MLELAPNNPYSLTLAQPLLARLGWHGAGLERLQARAEFGALISDALTLDATPWPGWLPLPAGLLWPHGGRAIRRARRDLRRWAAARLPVVVALQPRTPAEIEPLLAELDAEAHPALLLDATANPLHATELLRTLRSRWHAPLLLELPAEPLLVPQWSELDAADALVLGRGALATLPAADGWVSGRCAGPCAMSTILATLQALRERWSLPIVAAAATPADSAALAAAGAVAILHDTALWSIPAEPQA